MYLNSTKVVSFNFDLKFLRAHFSAKFWAFLEKWHVQPKYGELTFECVYPLPEMWHQAFCDILEPPGVNQLYLLCKWCSQASGFNKSIEVSQFALKAFWYIAI